MMTNCMHTTHMEAHAGGVSSSTWEVPLRVWVQVPLWVQEATVVPVVPGLDQHQAVLVG